MGAGASSLEPLIGKLAETTTVINIQEDEYWEQLWSGAGASIDNVFQQITPEHIRAIKKTCPKNLATLCRRAVLKLHAASNTGVASAAAQSQVVAAAHVLVRVIPVIFEDPNWQGFWWTQTPVGVVVSMPAGSTEPAAVGQPEGTEEEKASVKESVPLAETLLSAILDLLFAPKFTAFRPAAARHAFQTEEPQAHRPASSVDPSDWIWAPGVGFKKRRPMSRSVDVNRTALLRLLLVCVSKPLYSNPVNLKPAENPWLQYLTSGKHARTLPLVQSMFNTLITYDPIGMGVPYNYVFVSDDTREELVELCGQLLAIVLDFQAPPTEVEEDGATVSEPVDNVMALWLAAISEEKDLDIIVDGFSLLLNSSLQAVWMPGSQKRVNMHQEIMVLFWKLCDSNKKFLFHVLKTGKVLDIVGPILHHINEARLDEASIGLLHVGIYVLLLLSGERNFAVRLNKLFEAPYKVNVPAFYGNYGDLIILVIHNLMIGTNSRLTPLYDCLLTVVVNISPYLKSVCLVSANKLVHLFEVFSSPKFLFRAPENHHLVYYLLEAFNNMIQYQFEGNKHLVYVLIRRRNVVYGLQNLTLSPFEESSEAVQALGGASKIVYAPDRPIPDNDAAAAAGAGKKKAMIMSKLPAESVKEHFTVADDADESGSPPRRPPQQAAGTAAKAKGSPKTTVIGMEHVAPRPDAEKFVPTNEWLKSWHTKMPIETIARLLQVLAPQVEKICVERGVTDEAEILEFLKNGTLVGLLPVPHPILIRKYSTNPGCSVWFTTFIWGVIYLKNFVPPLWHLTRIRLFKVQEIGT